MLSDWVRLILQATVYDAAIQTPLEPAKLLSRRFSNDIRFKREDLQPVFSFKLRGAYNRISQLSPEEQALGVITASAGNHAQGVAYSASRLKINNIIVMPRTTPDFSRSPGFLFCATFACVNASRVLVVSVIILLHFFLR